MLAKEGNFFILENNTLVRMTVSAVNFSEPLRGSSPASARRSTATSSGTTPVLFENYTSAVMQVTVEPQHHPDELPGTGNLQADPLLLNLNSNTITCRTITNDFRLRPGSPALGTGPNGLDMGALVPAGRPSRRTASPTPLTAPR